MYNRKVSLGAVSTSSVDVYGDLTETVTTSSVFCKVVSADEKEKNLANSRGESAELVIVLADTKLYDGQPYVIVDGDTYKVTDKKFSDTSKELRLVIGRWETH